MLEIASQMILCLLLAALLGFIIGYLFGKMTCANDDCGQEENAHTAHTEDTLASTKDNAHTNTEATTLLSNREVSSSTSIPTHASADSIKADIKKEASLTSKHTENNAMAETSKEKLSSSADTSAKTIPDTQKNNTEKQTTADTALEKGTTSVTADTKKEASLASKISQAQVANKVGTKDVNASASNESTATTQNIDTASNNQTDKTDSPALLSEPRKEGKDNLSRIKGIGMKLEEELNRVGIYHFDQIAKWSEAHIDWADKVLGFPGRAKRENWVEQAKTLSEGKETEFSKRVDAGEVSSSKKS